MSNQMTVSLNISPEEPSIADLLAEHKKNIMFTLNSHHLGTIQAFDQVHQTAQVSINYTKTIFTFIKGAYQPQQINYPLLTTVPVIVLTGGSSGMTFPIQQGDQCILLCNDRDIDNWFNGQAFGPVATSRAHALTDAFALVGIHPLAKSLSNYDTTRAVMRGGSAVLGVNQSNNKILISNQTPSGSGGSYTYSTTLQTVLTQLLTALNVFMTATAAATTAGQIAAAASTFGPAAITAQTAIQALLE